LYGWKDNWMLAKPLAACTYFNSFRVIQCLTQCISPKIAIFTTFLFLLGDAPGVIALNVVWMESEFDAYKLYRCMYPSNYNSLRDIGNMRRVVLATATVIGGNGISLDG